MKVKIQEDMEHVCDETKLVFVKQEGDLITYKWSECKKGGNDDNRRPI